MILFALDRPETGAEETESPDLMTPHPDGEDAEGNLEDQAIEGQEENIEYTENNKDGDDEVNENEENAQIDESGEHSNQINEDGELVEGEPREGNEEAQDEHGDEQGDEQAETSVNEVTLNESSATEDESHHLKDGYDEVNASGGNLSPTSGKHRDVHAKKKRQPRKNDDMIAEEDALEVKIRFLSF